MILKIKSDNIRYIEVVDVTVKADRIHYTTSDGYRLWIDVIEALEITLITNTKEVLYKKKLNPKTPKNTKDN